MVQRLITLLRQTTTIRFRIFSAATLILLFYCVCICSSLTSLGRLAYEKHQAILFSLTEVLAKAANQSIWREDPSMLESVVTSLLGITPITGVSVIDSSQHRFVAVGNSDNRAGHDYETISMNLTPRPIVDGFENYEVDVNAKATGPVGRLDITIDRARIRHDLLTLMFEHSLVITVASLLTFPLISLLTRSVTNPLRYIFADIARFKAGEIDHMYNHHGFIDECAVLKASLYSAGKTLQEQNDELRRRLDVAIDARKHAAELETRGDIFIVNLVRELATPLGGIKASLALIESTALEAQTQLLTANDLSVVDYVTALRKIILGVDIAKQSSQQLTSLMGRIGTSSGYLDDTKDLYYRPVELVAPLAQLLSHYEGAARRKGLDFQINLPNAEQCWVSTDWILVAQVIDALLSNAIRFTQRGSVAVSANVLRQSTTTHLYIDIKDTGMGLSTAERANIIALFHEASKPASYLNGIGTGLPIARAIVDKLGGSLALKTTANAAGSWFAFDCAFSNCPPGTNVVCLATKPSNAMEQNLQLLYVDGSAIDQQIMQRFCQKYAGINLIVSKTPQDAWYKFQCGHFDCCLLSDDLPPLKGEQLVKYIRRHSSTFLVAMSHSSSATNRRQILDAGFDALLQKPYSADDFKRIIGKLTASAAIKGGDSYC